MPKLNPETVAQMQKHLVVHTESKAWKEAVALGSMLVEHDKDDFVSWMFLIGAEIEMGAYQDAYTHLQIHFSASSLPVAHYGMAVCACQLNRITEAKVHVADLLAISGEEARTELARDSRFQPLWASNN